MEPARTLTASDLLAAKPPAPTPLEIPTLGGRVYVRAMSATERDAWETEQWRRQQEVVAGRAVGLPNALVNIRARLVARTACDETGKLLFTVEQAAELGKSRADVLDAIWNVARRLAGLTKEDEAELLGNRDGGGNDDASRSDSPASSGTEASTGPAAS